jgi:hypothetical protein
MALVTSEGDHMFINKYSCAQSVCGVGGEPWDVFSWSRVDTGVAIVTPPSKDSYKKSKIFIHSTVNSILKLHSGA